MLIAYSKGVNFYINNLKWDEIPIEYKILDYSPEYWSPLKTCILLKAMSLDLSGRNSDLLYTEIASKYSIEDADFLYPEMPHKNDPIINEKKPHLREHKLQEKQINEMESRLNTLKIQREISSHELKIKNKELFDQEKKSEIYKKFKNIFPDAELLEVKKKD